jgi:hypothetical protein
MDLRAARRAWVPALMGAAGLVVGAVVTRGEGIPSSAALQYSGTLLDNGTPVNGSRSVTVSLWSAASGGNPLCRASGEVTVAGGRFSLPLGDDCTEQVRANRDLWVESAVGTVSYGRKKLGAAPYAVEAERAGTAGALRGTPVATTAPAEGQVLALSGGRWTPSPPAADSPAQALAKVNEALAGGGSLKLGAPATADPQFDLRWMVMHGAAAAGCAAVSPVGDSFNGHLVIPKPGGVSCKAACAANTGGVHTTCRTTMAVGSIRPTQARGYSDVVSQDYNYSCDDAMNGYDETRQQGLDDAYTAYCCCYKA